jgi:hypothetical protein
VFSKNVLSAEKSAFQPLVAFWAILELLSSEMAAESPFHRDLLHMHSLLQSPLLMSRGDKVPFQPLFNIYEKLAFQKGGFSATFLSMFKKSTSILDPNSRYGC